VLHPCVRWVSPAFRSGTQQWDAQLKVLVLLSEFAIFKVASKKTECLKQVGLRFLLPVTSRGNHVPRNAL
jgi:hypothetical protein